MNNGTNVRLMHNAFSDAIVTHVCYGYISTTISTLCGTLAPRVVKLGDHICKLFASDTCCTCSFVQNYLYYVLEQQ